MGAPSRPFTPLMLLFSLLIPIFYVLDKNILHRQYVFDPVKLQAISQARIAQHGNDTESLMRDVHRDLRAEYGDAVVPEYSQEDWFWNNAGGAMVRLTHFPSSHFPQPPSEPTRDLLTTASHNQN